MGLGRKRGSRWGEGIPRVKSSQEKEGTIVQVDTEDLPLMRDKMTDGMSGVLARTPHENLGGIHLILRGYRNGGGES